MMNLNRILALALILACCPLTASALPIQSTLPQELSVAVLAPTPVNLIPVPVFEATPSVVGLKEGMLYTNPAVLTEEWVDDLPPCYIEETTDRITSR
jgi:hypothetical protein